MKGEPLHGYWPAWSPDGNWICFVPYPEGGKGDLGGYGGLTLVRSDGSDLHELSADLGDASPDWSPDGMQIAASSNEGIFLINRDGSSRRLLTHEASNWGPKWSPDGTSIVFRTENDGRRDLWIMGSDGANQRRLVVNGDMPSWRSLK